MPDVSRVLLGEYPTPVEPLPSLSRARAELWVKRDDLTSPVYGGNKVRKLEYLLADARARGRARIVTLGAVGSHHVLATTIYGRREGFDVGAVLVPQPRTEHARTNARADLAQGLAAWPASRAAAPVVLGRHLLDRGAYFVQIGGSSALGAMGYVDGARELAAQVRAGCMPMPDLVVVTLGSGGTAAGIAAGLELEGLPTRVLAVTVADPPRLVEAWARMLARRCVARAGGRASRAQIAARLETTSRWLGGGYGCATEEGRRATERAREAGLALDPTYTSKAFAAALARVEEGRERVILFWHTLSSAPMAPLLSGAPAELPSRVDALLE